jgi:hypothetical protein
VIGAIIVAVIVGATTRVAGQIAFATVRAPLIPAVIESSRAMALRISVCRLMDGEGPLPRRRGRGWVRMALLAPPEF